ncbi:MAG: hypothetical protein JF614_31605 [Acidobacteria bacterium]|nr:hypothetical protein [Acidobacteriota bacterium]
MRKNVIFIVILVAVVATTFLPTPAAACYGYCDDLNHCRISLGVTGMTCSNLGGGCIEYPDQGCGGGGLAALPSNVPVLTQEAFVASLAGKTSAPSPSRAIVACSVGSD